MHIRRVLPAVAAAALLASAAYAQHVWRTEDGRLILTKSKSLDEAREQIELTYVGELKGGHNSPPEQPAQPKANPEPQPELPPHPKTAPPAEGAFQPSDLEYLGSIAMPGGRFGESEHARFHYGGGGLAYHPQRDTLFLKGHSHGNMFAEIKIPALDPGQPATAEVLQNFAEPSEGIAWKTMNNDQSPSIGGAVAFSEDGRQLIFTTLEGYDADANHRACLFARPTDLSVRGKVAGPVSVGTIPSGFLAGYACTIPDPYRTALGCDIALGCGGANIARRSSQGPGLIAFNSQRLPEGYKPLVYYTIDQGKQMVDPSTGREIDPDHKNLVYLVGGITRIKGVAWIDDRVVFFGPHGLGTYCYDTGEKCNDPAKPDRGGHAYPYRPWYWSYSAVELMRVARGEKQPWEARLASYGSLLDAFPAELKPAGQDPWWDIAGVAYDRQNKRLFVSVPHIDENYELPRILVYRVRDQNT